MPGTEPGIVHGSCPDQSAHVFNAVVQRGAVNFIDFQSARAASFNAYDIYVP
jgi:hypothetical protein